MKIAYVYHLDAANPAVQSGRPASILRSLAGAGATVIPVFPLKAKPSRGSSAWKALLRMLGRHYRGDRDPAYLVALGAEAARRIEAEACDLVFCPGSEAISRLNVEAPIVFCADATFANMVDYYWDFTGLSPGYLRKGHAQETSSLRRASLAVYPSEWAARSAVDFYGANPAKVAVVPFGANLGSENRRDEVEGWISARRAGRVRLLFVGRSWKRKGGEIVVDAARHLVQRGVHVQLDLVSGEAPRALASLPWVSMHGELDPNRPAARSLLGRLFREAHFVVVPSRAEAYGMTFAEAAAFGVPAIGTRTGGIPAVISDGVSGFTLPLAASGRDYAELISGVLGRREQYAQMCRSAFSEFERRLNWRAFSSRVLELAQRNFVGQPQEAGGHA